MKKYILEYCNKQRQKKKAGNIRVTYEELLWQAAGQSEKRQNEIRTEKYSIVGEPLKRETNQEYITLLHSYVGTKVFEYYHYKKAEFEKDRETIDIIYNYYRRHQKEWMTSNELGFYLFGDEKAFEQPEEGSERKKQIGRYTAIIKRMGLDMEKDLQARYTKEPFFCQIKQTFFEKDKRKILIVENKDSYFRLKNHSITNEYDSVIYGEGWKVISSFSLAEETGIMVTDKIDYFGDLDPEGFVIYKSLKTNYPEYEIHLQTEFYKKTIDAVSGRMLQKRKGIVRDEILQDALETVEEFDDDTADYLKKVMQEGYYIPQEAIVLSLLSLS